MTLTQDLKQKAIDVGFVSVGISNPNILCDLPYGWVGKITKLRSPEEELPTVKSVILMCLNAWDKAFYLAVDSPNWQGYGMHHPDREFESYFFDSEIMKNKAWVIVDYLERRGFDSVVSSRIPLKTAAVKCGLGCQGKNTLLITPRLGPRVGLISVQTAAELDIDEPYKEDLCGNCEKCLRACPTKALKPYRLKINRCMTYSAESPHSSDVPEDVRKLEKKLIQRPTSNSYIECTTCIDVCPIGKLRT
jgi:epoxyqueuosine reductase QueG